MDTFPLIARLEAQGDVVKLQSISPVWKPPVGGGLRGVISGFSRGARRRMFDLMNRLDVRGVRCTFLTLTFAGAPAPEEAKAAFKRFTMRLRRRFPDMAAVWRLELQQRGSIHFHLICFRLPFVAQRELQDIWTACTKEARSIIDIRLLRSKKRVMGYVSKYIAKKTGAESAPSLDEGTYQHAEPTMGLGRHWGYVNRDGLPFGELLQAFVEDGEEARYFRWSAYAASNRKAAQHGISCTLYTQEARRWFEAFMEVEKPDQEYLLEEFRHQYTFMLSQRTPITHF